MHGQNHIKFISVFCKFSA